MTVCPSINTEHYLHKMIQDDPDSKLYYKYEPAEWKFESQGADEAFDHICTKLRDYVFTFEDDNKGERFSNFRDTLYEICMESLEELNQAFFLKFQIEILSFYLP